MNATLTAAIAAMRAQLAALEAAAGLTDPEAELEYPAKVTRCNVTVLVDEAIAKDWRPSSTAIETAVEGKVGFVGEPSNGGRIGAPLRSAAGYPLFYAIGRGPNGEDVPTGLPPDIVVGDEHFSTDHEAQTFAGLLAVRDAKIAAGQAAAAATRAAKVYTGPIAAPWTVAEQGWFYNREAARDFAVIDLLAGPGPEIADMLNNALRLRNEPGATDPYPSDRVKAAMAAIGR